MFLIILCALCNVISLSVLVSACVVHQLVLSGYIRPSVQHVSMQLMAGLHHGPYPDLPSDLYPATKELFSFAAVENEVQRRHMHAMHFLLESGVKVLCAGSVHDQTVPLYSSLIQSFPSCSNLLRAIFVEYSSYQPDFLYALLSLIVFSMNVGAHGTRAHEAAPHSDQILNHSTAHVEALIHLSGFLRGGLLEKNGGAHSAIHRLTDLYE